jgi:hypothetical protein
MSCKNEGLIQDDIGVQASVSHEILSQGNLIKNLSSIQKSLKNFLFAIHHAALELNKDSPDDDFYYVSRGMIKTQLEKNGFGCSDALVSRRFKELVELKVCERTIHIQNNRSRRNIYTLSDISLLAALPSIAKKTPEKDKRRTKTIVNVQKDLFNHEANGMLLDNPASLIYFHEQLFNGVLDAAMRLSGRDARKVIEVTCNVAGAPLVITSSCSSIDGSNIAVLADQRAMRVVESFCKKEIVNRRLKLQDQHGSMYTDSMVPNLFHIDIHDLCKLMGMKVVNTNLDSIVEMMRRLADTTFTVDARNNKWFRESFSAMPAGFDGSVVGDTFEFRFLQNFEIAHGNGVLEDLFGAPLAELRPRFYSFSLEMRMFLSLLHDDSTNIFLSHEGLSVERSGIIQRTYNWMRAFIRDDSGSRWYSISELKDRLIPAVRLDNFSTYFKTAISNFQINDSWKNGVSGEALVYGYYVEYERRNGEDMFCFKRDPSDPIVGVNSRHEVLKRQQMLLDRSMGFVDD